jgi:hypothetical protein
MTRDHDSSVVGSTEPLPAGVPTSLYLLLLYRGGGRIVGGRYGGGSNERVANDGASGGGGRRRQAGGGENTSAGCHDVVFYFHRDLTDRVRGCDFISSYYVGRSVGISSQNRHVNSWTSPIKL